MLYFLSLFLHVPVLLQAELSEDRRFPAWILLLIIAIIVIWVLRKASKRNVIVKHWYHLFEDLQTSSKDFYVSLETILKDMKVPDLTLKRVTHSERGVLSDRREYLLISRGKHSYTVCAAPFGRAYFFSWWQGEAEDGSPLLSLIPFIGTSLERLASRKTYHQLDTEIMFQDVVHNIVLQLVNGITEPKGIRGLTDLERTPLTRTL